MSRKKKEQAPVLETEGSTPIPPKRRIKSFKPKKDIILSPGFELRKTVILPEKRKKKWRHFFTVMGRNEKIVFSIFLSFAIFSFLFICLNFYFQNTRTAPADGGTIVEGSLSQPRFINPIYANSDIDRDLSELVFSGLMKYDKDMNIIPDLAASFPEIEDDGRIYKFYLKDNLFWQDGAPLTADDVIFTIKTIQNPELKSPYLANWVGVKAEKISDTGVRFTLQKPYAAFIENCALKIIPKHIWENTSSESFPFQSYNLENAVGNGMYRIKEVKRNNATQKVEYITLEKNNHYYGAKPHISQIKFQFFDNRDELAKAARKGKITGGDAGLASQDSGWNKINIYLPRYFALFLNPEKSKVLEDKNARIALTYGTNKKELGKNTISSPLLPDFYGIQAPSENYSYDPSKAADLLEKAGYKDTDGNGIREIPKDPAFQFKSRLETGSSGKEVTELQKCLKVDATGYFGQKTKEALIDFQEQHADEILKPYGYNKGTGSVGEATKNKLNQICFGDPNQKQELEFTLVTVEQPDMKELAESVKRQWAEIGVNLQIQSYPVVQLEQEYIKTRNYDILLFGEVLGAVADPFPFWHSSQKNDPGLNLAGYENKELDKLLEDNRKVSDEKLRKDNLAKMQEIIIKDAPAIFLFSPEYAYLVSDSIKGISDKKAVNPSERFADIEKWYIKTRRVWK